MGELAHALFELIFGDGEIDDADFFGALYSDPERLRGFLTAMSGVSAGPAAQIALMHRELVETRKWLTEQEFLNALSFCMLLPGPEATQLATYIGWLMHGTRGGVWAGVLFVLPSLLILTLLSWLYMVHGQHAVVAGLFYGIKPAVTALVLQAAVRMVLRVVHAAWFTPVLAGGVLG